MSCANNAVTSARSLPRFLLPRLSWSVAPVSRSWTTCQKNLTTNTAPRSSDRLMQERVLRPRISCVVKPGCSPTSPRIALPSRSRHPRTAAFHTTTPRTRDHHFDTLKFVQRLRDEGFTEAQSAAMMRVLSDVIEESIQNLTRTMVLREDSAKATYTQKVDFAKLRSELQSTDALETSTTRASHDRLTADVAKLHARLRDEIARTQASVRLDLNLEKGRIREEATLQALRIKETESKIEMEVAALREKLEAVKFQTLQWLMGVCTGTAALILGAWRLLM